MPRNAKAFEQSQAVRAVIRAVMLQLRQRSPLAPLTEKSVAPHLPFQMPRSTLYRHMAAIIRAESNTDTSETANTDSREFVSLSE